MRDSVRKCIYKTCRDTIQSKDKKQTQLRYSRPTEPNLKLSRRIRTSPPLLGFVSNQPWETCADFSVVKSTRGDSYVNGPLIKMVTYDKYILIISPFMGISSIWVEQYCSMSRRILMSSFLTKLIATPWTSHDVNKYSDSKCSSIYYRLDKNTESKKK